ncbi:MAG: FG-GAP repeat domain-containing protein, partial [Planctomycetota bacterium]
MKESKQETDLRGFVCCRKHRLISHYSKFLLILIVMFCQICSGDPIVLHDVTRETGITFKHTDGSSGNRYIMETVTAGLALFDYDNDGDVDIYFLSGMPLKGTKYKIQPKNELYRNEGDWKFTNVTEQARVGDTGYGLGVAVGDYDNDGDPDIYVNNHGPNTLYRNNGNGTFTDVTKKAGVANGSYTGAGACFLDMDKDGDLDLYVSSYLQFSYDTHRTGTADGFPVYVGPNYFPAAPDVRYRNNGDGTFTDVSKNSGIAEHLSWGMGTVCGDYDNDG